MFLVDVPRMWPRCPRLIAAVRRSTVSARSMRG
jgi:hypothetical protein